MIEGRNSAGVFLCCKVNRDRSDQDFIIFPAGRKGYQWRRPSHWIQCILRIENQISTGGSRDGRITVQGRSFVDVLRSNPSSAFSLPYVCQLEEKNRDLSSQLDAVLVELRHFRDKAASSFSSENDNALSSIGDSTISEIHNVKKLVLEEFHPYLSSVSTKSNFTGSSLTWGELCGFTPTYGGGATTLEFLFSDGSFRGVSADVSDPAVTTQNSNFEFSNELVITPKPLDCADFSSAIKEVVGPGELEKVSTPGPIITPRFSRDNDVSVEGSDPRKCLQERRKWEKCAANLKEILRKEEEDITLSNVSHGSIAGERICLDGEFYDGLTILKMLIPPPRAKKSRLAFYYWSSLVSRPFLAKLRSAGIDIDSNLYGDSPL